MSEHRKRHKSKKLKVKSNLRTKTDYMQFAEKMSVVLSVLVNAGN